MAKQELLVYTINVPDQSYIDGLIATQVADAQGYRLLAPLEAAAITAADLSLPALPIQIDPDDPFSSPSIRSRWFAKTPNGEEQFPLDKAQFTRRSGGWFGVGWLFGEKTLYTWWGHYEYAPGLGTGVPGTVTPVPMPARRWIDGGELPAAGEGAAGATVDVARRASRHAQGFGYTFDNTTNTRIHDHTEAGAAAQPGAWERIYLRVARFPDTPTRIWRAHNSITAGGPLLTLTAGGTLQLNDFDGISTATPIQALGVLAVNTWYKLDLVYSFGALGATLPYVKGYLNGTKVVDIVGAALVAMQGGTKLVTLSTIGGGSVAGVANNAIWHADDWIGADVPPVSYEIGGTADFIKGSRVALVAANGLAADHAPSWLGDWRLTRQRPVTPGVTAQLTSSTSDALLAVTTDAAIEVDGQANQVGIIALAVGLFSDKGGGGANGTLGWKLPGGVNDLAAVVQSFGSVAWATRLYRPSGQLTPITPLAGLELKHAKGASADPAKVQALVAVAEILGVFGDEDLYPSSALGTPIADPPPGTVTPHIGIHNAPYPHTPYAQQLTPPQAPVVIKTGEYTGTGAGQDLRFRAPVHFLWIRPAAGGSGGVSWWASLNAAHVHGMKAYAPDTLLEVLIDPTFVEGQAVETDMTLPPAPDNVEQATAEANQLAYGFPKHGEGDAVWANYLDDPDYYWRRMLGDQAQGGPDEAVAGLYAVPPSPWLSTQQQQTLVRLAGSHADSNALGVLYHYVAFCDPGMRFCNAGALTATQFGSDLVSPLDVEQFLPEWAFVQQEQDGASVTQTLMVKGLGSAAAAISVLTLAEIASGLQFGTGTLTYKAGLALAGATQHGYLVFRRNDGSGDPGVPSVLWLGTYIGDGGGIRTINVTPSGKRPMWAIAVGHNGTAYIRDPYHLGTTSTQFPNTANAATGIIGGAIDAIQFGAALNQAGVIYDFLVFPGSATAGNGGWSVPGEFIPVDPAAPHDGPWDDAPEAPEPPDPGTLPAFPPGPPPADFGTQCAAGSTRIINQALSRIGVSKQIGDIVTENTMEAVVARLHYSDDVDTVLRDFAWPFATHYATLVVVAGPAPVAAPDWLYAYRRPSDCVFERRLCVSRGGGVDPTPPPFQLGSDATGGLIYTNQPNAVLEYTARPACVAAVGDPLFRDALTWRHAASLAPALSRMTDMTADCLTKYQTGLALAFAVLRPGNPGRPATVAPTIDTAPAAEAANVALVNRGLLRIGAQTITNLTTDQSRGAVAVRAIFEAELQSVLRDFAWPFATRYADPLPLVAGTPTAWATPDWTYSYRLPAECVMARRLVSPLQVGRAWDPDPPKFRTGTDATGDLLFTHLENARLEYTARLDGAVRISDHVFQEAFAWRLAAVLAPSLAQADPEGLEQEGRGTSDPRLPKTPKPTAAQLRQRLADGAWQQYWMALNVARASAMKEQQAFPDGPAPWITARGDGWRTRWPWRP